MNEICITKDSKFRNRAKAFNISPDTLEYITYKYYEETKSTDREPSDTYIKAQLGEFPYIEKEDTVDAAHRMWELKYSTPLEFNSEEEMLQAKTLAETYFPKKAVHVSTNSQGKWILTVQEPVGNLGILYRKDFPDWQNYYDYLMVMGDAIPQSERQKEPRKTGPQSFTFNDGITVTAPFQPNEQQVQALNAMSDFINSDETSMTLSGYAGTGKTSLMEMIAAKMKKQHRNIVFSASTNKAAAVLRDRVRKSGFTAQTLNKVFGIQVEVDSTKPYDASNLVNKLKDADITPGTVVVIDEASMINEENYNILNGIAEDNHLKIIYTGDKGQLAPVGESQISKVFRDKNGRIVTLTKVERTEDNAILKEATAIRNGQPLSGESSFNNEGKGVAYIKSTNKEAKKAIVEAFVPMLKKNPDFFRILAYTNKAVADYNTAVRNTLGYHDNIPRVGEPIVGYSNWGAEYDRKTKQTIYKFINSESYKVTEVKPAKQVFYSLDDDTKIQMTAIPITLEDAMGKRVEIDLMDIKENQQNRQAATLLAKEKARLFDVARHLPRREQPAIYQKINDIEKFLFVNDSIREGSRTLQAKTFDFGYAMTVHKSQGSTFTHVLVDDADISTARNQTAIASYDAPLFTPVDISATMVEAQKVDLGLGDMSSEVYTAPQEGTPFQKPQLQGLNAQTINREANNVANMRQQLEYVAVSRATDTVTIISNNVKTEDSPLNHLKDSSVNSNSVTVSPTVPQIHEVYYTKHEAQAYINDLVAEGIDRNSIRLEHIPATETEDDYYIVSTIQPQDTINQGENRSNEKDNLIAAIIAPYFNTSYQDYVAMSTEEQKQMRKAFSKAAHEIAKAIGITIDMKQASFNIGGYQFEDGGSIVEPSFTFRLDTTPEKARLFAALMGDLGYEQQEAVVSNYDISDIDSADGIRFSLEFKDSDTLLKLIDQFNIKNFTYDKTNGVLSVLSFDAADVEKFHKLVQQLKENGYDKESETFYFKSSYDGRTGRKTLYGKWLKAQEGNSQGVQPELYSLVQEALKKVNYYLGKPSNYEGLIKPDEDTVFVFGSNPEGRHGAGAAKVAREQFGAVYGQGEGLQGNSYALPTKDLRVKENKSLRSISPEQITESIRRMYEVANQNPDKLFKVAYTNSLNESTLNGYTGAEMIQMFKDAGPIPSNVVFSKNWTDHWNEVQSTHQPQQFAQQTTAAISLNITPAKSVDKKATAKGSISNKFIGFADGIQGSSTAEYARQTGDRANTGNYSSADTVFVSIPGMRGNTEVRHAQQDRTIQEALKALNAGATLVTDNEAYTKSSSYNEGEKKLAEALKQAGAQYSERIVDGQTLGVWKLSPTTTQPILQPNEEIGHYIVDYNTKTVRHKYISTESYKVQDLSRIERLRSVLERAGEQGGEHRIKYSQFKKIDELITKVIEEKGDYREKATTSLLYKIYGDDLTGVYDYNNSSKELVVNNWVFDFLQVTQESPSEIAALIDFVTDKYDKDSSGIESAIQDYSDVITAIELLNQAQQAPVPEAVPSRQTSQKVSLPGYEYFNDLYEDTEVDAAWKVPILQDLDSQLSTENTEEENLQILSQMDRILQSPSQEDYEKAPTPQKEETNMRMEDYQRRNYQLNNLLDNEVGLQASEIRDTAETIMNTLSDIITEIQQHPEKVREYWPTLKTEKDLSRLSRREIVETVNINRLIELAKKRFDDLKWSEDPAIDSLYNSAHLLDQHDLIMDNWDAVMRFAGDIFVANEGFGFKRNSNKGNYETETREYQGYDYDDYSSPQDSDAIAEEEDEQEHWQVEAKTIDIINSMSELVRMAIHNCYVLDKDGNKILDKWGMPKRVDKHKAVKQILYWTAGTLNINEMIERLEAHQDRNPWVSQLTKRLADSSGNETDFQSQFYGVMHRHFQLYGIGQYEKGHYVHKILNRHNALSEVMKGISAQFQMHQHPLFNRDSTINQSSLNALEGWFNELEGIRKKYSISKVFEQKTGRSTITKNVYDLSDTDIEKAAELIVAASKMLGFPTTVENVLPLVNTETIFNANNALRLILDNKGLKAEAKEHKTDYNPFGYKTRNNIRGAVEKFLSPLIEEMEETTLNTIFEDGKMYQSNTIPSFLSQLFDSFAQSEENFRPWVETFYGNSQWFRKNGIWRTPWLATMMDNSEARRAFEHHVQLNFNKHNYMRNMSPEEYIISCITNYFFSNTNEKDPDTTEAWFRVPIQSNKPSSEFIKFFSFRGNDYKDKIVAAMQPFFHQELDRIDTVRKRNKQKEDASAITSWDENGRHFMFLPFLNSYLVDRGELVCKEGNDLFRNTDGTVDTQKNNELKTLLNKKLNAEKDLTPDEEVRLSKLVEEATKIYMQNRVNQILDSYEKNGILKAAERVENIRDYRRSVRDNIENFLWNDFFAANNILQLTITDKAFYPTTAELQKRLAELHAPGTKANKFATDYQGNRVSDGTYRTILISDYEDFTANIIDNLTEIFDRKIAQAPKDEKEAWIALKESLVGKNGRYRRINVTDGQAYSSPSSYRKKMFMFGKWSPEAERTYQKIRSGNFTLSDLEAVFQPLKPFVYGHLHKKMGVQKAPIQEMNVPFQAKNSEYLLLMADALMQGQETGRPNILHSIYDIMEESERLFPTKGIDTVQFSSAIKSGAQGVIRLSDFTESNAGREQAYTAIREQIYVKNAKGEIVDYNYDTFVQSTDYDNYALQQEVPKHFQDHQQAEPSQKRVNIISDLDMWLDPQGDKADPANINYYTWKDPDGTEHKLNAQEFRREYERVHAKNIEDSFDELSKLFHLESLDRVERNIALSELLQEEIESSPRYGIDLMQACQIDPKTGDFRIPKGDPVQSKRIEQLINSIIKSRVNKQELAGGPIVQVTNWGTSRQLHIRFNDKKGGLLMTNEEFETEREKDPELFSSITYQDYCKENQAGIAHFEIFAPAAWKKHLEKFKNPDGTINLEAVEKCDPNLLRMITSRIPNEDKYSIAHGKIVGFLPEVAGEAIMFPYELTEIDDSDFDVDKRYCHVFEIEDIVEDTPKVKELLFKTVADSYKKSHNGTEIPYNLKKKVNDSINMLLDNPEVMRHTDKFSENLYNAYQNILHTKFPYKVKYPKKGSRGDRNNQILNMDWAVMSNEMTAAKILNPGGFDIPKHDAYVIAAYRTNNGDVKWEQLDNMTTKQLQKMMGSDGDLAWFDTQVKFYKQNAAGSTLIGVFAVNKVAHALLEADDILIDVEDVCGKGNTFTIADMQFKGRIPLDPSQDSSGAYIGKGLGSMVGASADTAKDPWLDLIDINMTTAGVYNALLRLGMPQKDAALFMSQDAIVSALSEFNRTNLEETTTFDAIISKKLAVLRSKYSYNENSEINKEPITRNELKAGLLPSRGYINEYKDKIDYKVLLAFSRLQNLAKAIRKPTLVTRLNSVASAVGPLIIDNIILEHKLMQFLESSSETGTGFYSSDGTNVDIDDLLHNHPMLREFAKAIDSREPDCPTRLLFADMPAGSRAFKGLIDAFPEYIKEKLYEDRQLLSKLSDFYQSYMLIANEIIKPIQIGNYIKGFPEYFIKAKLKEKYPNNAFIQAIQTTFDKKSGRGFLNINTTGMMEQEKERLRMAWTDLHKVNPKLSTQIFTYAFFRGGIGFSPKTWMGLVPTYVKEHLTTTKEDGTQTSYVDTYRNFPTDVMVDEVIVEQFIRNNWDNNKLVPKKGGEGTMYDYSHLEQGSLWVHARNDINDLQGILFMRTVVGDKTYLWKRITPVEDTESSIEFKRVLPLGNNGEYVEMSLDTDLSALEIVEEISENNDPTELQDSAQKDTAISEDTSAPVPVTSVTEQAKSITDIVKYLIDARGLSEKVAVDYVTELHRKAQEGTVSKFSKKDIQRIARDNGLNLDVDRALEWFKRLC